MSDGETRILQKDNSAIIEKLTEYKKHHERKNERIKILEAQVCRLEKEIQAIYNSISWKITGPLRRLYGFFKDTK
ncbi:MAG: hypothetical protein H3C68_04430 [Deltaproteobacteria bacterium]|nr:hypothetical protein [Deltaproteobacteria bacterium]MBZ0219973.1 hypothetical protein [Deltaproteobacteria bacterium]